MKNLKRWIGMLLVAAMFTGCGKEEFVMEDYVRENPQSSRGNIMKTDTGFYYNAETGQLLSLHYYDVESGQNIFLCSKPECKHDGNEFCTATSDKYRVNSTYLYGGRIYIAVVENSESVFNFKLLSAAADGTELSEVVTYLSVNDTSMMPILGGLSREMIIHRGKAILTYQLRNKDNMEVGINGTFIYDLKTKELTRLTEYTLEESEDAQTRFSAYGDYIYYNTKIGHKNVLSRYNVLDGSIEDMKLQVSYNGDYAVMDEDTIYYVRGGNSLYEYHPSTGETTEHKDVFTRKETVEISDGITFENKYPYTPTDIMTDGNYLFVGVNVAMNRNNIEYYYDREVNGEQAKVLDNTVYVYDREFNEIAKVGLATSEFFGVKEYFLMNILDNEVYLRTPQKTYRCSMESFLSGEPEFEELFSFEVDYWSYEKVTGSRE